MGSVGLCKLQFMRTPKTDWLFFFFFKVCFATDVPALLVQPVKPPAYRHECEQTEAWLCEIRRREGKDFTLQPVFYQIQHHSTYSGYVCGSGAVICEYCAHMVCKFAALIPCLCYFTWFLTRGARLSSSTDFRCYLMHSFLPWGLVDSGCWR